MASNTRSDENPRKQNNTFHGAAHIQGGEIDMRGANYGSKVEGPVFNTTTTGQGAINMGGINLGNQEKLIKPSSEALAPAVSSEGSPMDTIEQQNIQENSTEAKAMKHDSTYTNTYGKVLMFNYEKFHDGSTRKGAEKDSKNVKQTFGNLGYTVQCHPNLDSTQTEKWLQLTASDQSLSLNDSLIIIINSHGNERTHFQTFDGKMHAITWVRDFFSNKNCPLMKDKPKVIIGNFCRGVCDETDDVPPFKIKEKLSHMITLFSVTDGTLSKRNPEEGSYFITALCQTLNENPNKELSVIMNITADKLEAEKKPHPTAHIEYPFKKFVFNIQNPGNQQQ